jgi:hypothetical protein
VQGDESSLTLYVSKVPVEVFGGTGVLTSDLRKITYWMADGGLARQEVRVITAAGATSSGPSGDEPTQTLAPEVQSLSFSYYDGSSWQSSWDSTGTGPDGVSPLGSPRAIAVTLKLTQPNGQPAKTYRHVVPILTANGTAQQQNTGGGS